MKTRQVNHVFINNLIWFVASLLLAFIVWVVATTQNDPITEERFNTRIPIRVDLAEGMTVVEQETDQVWVTVRAQQSVQQNLTAEDIIVRANLTTYGPGTYTVELDTQLARRGQADTQPRQITLTIENIQRQQVPVVGIIPEGQDVPINFTRQDPVFNESQVTVSGVASRVQRVVAAQAEFDLSDQRDVFNGDVRLHPVDADGDIVSGVTVEPQLVEATVEIRRNEGVTILTVVPRFEDNLLPSGYTVGTISYEPQTVFVQATREQLGDVTSLRTESIDLSGRAESFEMTVPVLLPEGLDAPILSNQNITVFVEIQTQTATRQFDNIPIDYVGLADDTLATDSPLESAVVLITGPQPVVDGLVDSDISVIVDLAGLEPGTYDLTPRAPVPHPQINVDGITVTPATITVTVIDLTAPEETPATNP